MQRRDHGLPQLDPGGRVLSSAEGGSEGLTLPAGAGGQQQVGKGSAGIGEHIHVHIEVQSLQGRPAPQGVPMAEEWIAPEQNHSLHWVRLPGQDGLIHFGGLHDAWVARRAQGMLGIAEPQGCLLPGKQLSARDGIGGGAGEKHVAAATIELPREGIEATHGPVGLQNGFTRVCNTILE